MNSDAVMHKLNVFISSKCGGKYAIMRQALKRLLEETGLTVVYCFESEPSSSEPIPSAFLNYVDLSQVLVLLVDNKDGISNATLSEYQRAKDLNKRIIAIFCDERKKKKTEVQEEIISKKICKYDTVHEFSDIAYLAYKAVMQDLIFVYSNKKEEQNEEDSEVLKSATISPQSFVEKNLLLGFDNVQKTILNVAYRDIEKVAYSSELDELACGFLQVVLCNVKFDSEHFSALKPLILERHSESVKNIIDMRLEAVKFYFSGNLDACVTKLTDASKIALSDSSIPKWICNDIAIDLRNMINTKSNINGEIPIHNYGQKIIDESKEYLYFPAIDRMASNIRETAIKEYNQIYLQSPYTVSLGGLEPIFKDVAPYFCTALLYGSITHIRIVKDLLIDILQALKQEYSDSEFNTELIKLLILKSDDKTLENIVRTFNQSYSIISSIEIQKILDAIDNLPLQHDQIHAKLILLKHFGNYFSDEQFSTNINWLSDYLQSIKVLDAKKYFLITILSRNFSLTTVAGLQFQYLLTMLNGYYHLIVFYLLQQHAIYFNIYLIK